MHVVRQGLRRRTMRMLAVGGGVVGLGLLGSAPAQAGGFTMEKFTPTQPPDTSAVTTVMGWLQWGGLAACVVGIIVAGASMALSHRRGGGGSEHAAALGWVLGGAILIGAASTIVGTLA